jgi:hypothetical protein
MNLAPPSSFFRRFIARPPAPESQDPADMGTAFGLEASLGPVSAFTGDDTAAAARADESPMGWLGRRFKRRG